MRCSCEPRDRTAWVVLRKNSSRRRFGTTKASSVICRQCGNVWRTMAKTDDLRLLTPAEREAFVRTRGQLPAL